MGEKINLNDNKKPELKIVKGEDDNADSTTAKQEKKEFSNYELVPFKNVYRISSDYYLFDEDTNELQPTTKGLVIDDYGRDRLSQVIKFFGFCFEPSHTDFKRSVNRRYNLYSEISHKPAQGKWDNINKMISHIFKDEYYEVALTYFWVLYMKPKHPLPVLGLVGGQNTGKTKFLELFKLIYQSNAKAIDPEDLVGNFNSGYADKLVILIDEKIDGNERIKLLNKLKKLATGGTINRKEKYTRDSDIQFYGKTLMASNDKLDMIKMEDENTRFLIIDVPALDGDDFDILSKAEKEIPYFLHYLENEYTPLKRESRTWFNVKYYQTEISIQMQLHSQSQAKRTMASIIEKYFSQNSTVNEIWFSAMEFYDAYHKQYKLGSDAYVQTVLRKDFEKRSRKVRVVNPFSENPHDTITQLRRYCFKRDEMDNYSVEAFDGDDGESVGGGQGESDEIYKDLDGNIISKEENDEIIKGLQIPNVDDVQDDKELPF